MVTLAGALNHAYLGLDVQDERVRVTLERFGLSWSEPEDLASAVTAMLMDGCAVGWVQGHAEVGPRALGHRSILANPGDERMGQRINAIKRREPWRPLAPSLAPEAALRLYGSIHSPYMLEAQPAADAARSTLPACVHVDNTSRIHTATEHTHRRFRALLTAMREANGTAACVNTSFNVGSEPIVNSPEDAVRSFYGSELDTLVIGPALIEKRRRS